MLVLEVLVSMVDRYLPVQELELDNKVAELVSIPVPELLADQDIRTIQELMDSIRREQGNIPEQVEYLVQVNTTLEVPEWEAYQVLAALVNTEVNYQPVSELDWDNKAELVNTPILELQEDLDIRTTLEHQDSIPAQEP